MVHLRWPNGYVRSNSVSSKDVNEVGTFDRLERHFFCVDLYFAKACEIKIGKSLKVLYLPPSITSQRNRRPSLSYDGSIDRIVHPFLGPTIAASGRPLFQLLQMVPTSMPHQDP